MAAAGFALPVELRAASRRVGRSDLDLSRLTPFVDRLQIPPRAAPVAGAAADTPPVYRVAMREVRARVHRDLPPTRFWSFGSTFPGPTFDVRRHQTIHVDWTNALPSRHFLPIDHTIHGAGADQPESRAVVHLHGAKVQPESDGHPDHWIVPGQSARFTYPNDQAATTLWYHDHTMGINRLNVYAGLIGAYLIRDADEDALHLPDGPHEIPLVLCDRLFDRDAQIVYPTSDDPRAPWVPEVFGDAMLVNGTLFPFLDAGACAYRLRLVNACNGSFLTLSMSANVPMHVIGGDQGLLPAPVPVDRLPLAPAERADVVVDLSTHAGATLHLRDDDRPIMQIRVGQPPPGPRRTLPNRLVPLAKLAESTAVKVRTHTLVERQDLLKRPMQMLLNDTPWHAPVTEIATLGSVEVWNLVNLTDDAHPIHLHLARFQVLERRRFDVFDYQNNNQLRFVGPSVAPEPGESGWKDTVRAYSGMVTRLIVHFDGYVGRYMWHCHVLEHGDHEMMRPMEIVSAAPAV